MAQFVVPSGDQATGSWTTTPLWSKIEETVASADGTTITSANNTAPDNADFTLTAGSDPAVSTGHILRALWNKDSSGGHAINAVLELWEGVPDTGTLRATLSVTGIGATPQTDTYTLSGAEADAISDYSNLYFRLSRQGDTGGNPSGRRSLVVDAVELELPDADSQSFSQTAATSTSNAAAISRKTATTKAATTSASPAIQRKTSVTKAVAGSATAGLTKKTATTLSASGSATATLSPKIVFTQTLAVATSATASLSRKIGKTLAAAGSASAALTRKTAKTLADTTANTAALTTGLSFKKTLAATTSAAASLSTKLTFGQVLAATTAVVAGLTRSIRKTLSAVGSAIAGLVTNATLASGDDDDDVPAKSLKKLVGRISIKKKSELVSRLGAKTYK